MGSFPETYYLCLSLRDIVHKASQSYPGKRSLDKQLLRLFKNKLKSIERILLFSVAGSQ